MFFRVRTPDRAPADSGFSLVEMAVVLVVIGLLAAAAAAVYRPAAGAARTQRAVRVLDGIGQAIVAFAVSHRRLPCADTDSDGVEGSGAGCGIAVGFQTGAVPYVTLGITMPGAPGADAGTANVVYGVYRNAAVNADLTVARERTGDAPGDPRFDDLGDFRLALVSASIATAGNTHVYVTGVGANENCASAVLRNAAVIIASPGGGDADGDGNSMDGVNAGLRLDGSGSKCFASPARRSDLAYDDRTRAIGFNDLAGALSVLD